MLRELREEIGLLSTARSSGSRRPPAPCPATASAFFLVRDVVYRPRRSLEVEEVREFDPDAPDTPPGRDRRRA